MAQMEFARFKADEAQKEHASEREQERQAWAQCGGRAATARTVGASQSVLLTTVTTPRSASGSGCCTARGTSMSTARGSGTLVSGSPSPSAGVQSR
eukprot:455983-Rhodomonas_salina.1